MESNPKKSKEQAKDLDRGVQYHLEDLVESGVAPA